MDSSPSKQSASTTRGLPARCSRCGLEKDLKEFQPRKNRPSGRTSHCRTCNGLRHAKYRASEPLKVAASQKAYRQVHPEKMTEIWRKASQRRDSKLRPILNEWKSRPCQDCGRSFPPCAMHADHRDPSTKRFNVSSLHRIASEARLKEELAKCDLVCACCHAIRTNRVHKERVLNGECHKPWK